MVLPTGDLILVCLCAESSVDHVSLTLLDDIPLDLGHGSARDVTIWNTRYSHYRFGSPSKLTDRTYDGLAECVQRCPLQSPVKNFTHLTASPLKVDVMLIIGHRVLSCVSHGFVSVEQGKRTLIVVKRTLTAAAAV